MKEFSHFLKLYFFRDQNRATLSVQTSPTHVWTFHFSAPTFFQVVEQYNSQAGVLTGPYFFHLKGDYVRFTFSQEHLESNFRIPTKTWESLIADFKHQFAANAGDLITCVANGSQQ